MRCAILFALSLLVGCSSLFTSGDIPEGYLCREDSADACPSGQVCDVSKGCCRKPGSSCNGPDLASVPTDLSTPPDLWEPSGCAGKGVRIAPGLYGCDGPIAKGQAASLCAADYTLTDSSLSPLEFSECGKINGFYLTTTLIYHSGLDVTVPVQCNIQFKDTLNCTQPTSTFRFRLGCGGFRFTGYVECYKSCGALYQAVSCYRPTPIECWPAQTPGIIDESSSNPNIGVLCRKK